MREFFCAYHSMLGAMRKLSDAECGRLFRALLKYSSGEQPDNLQGREELLFDVFAQQIDRDVAAYQKKCLTNRKNGTEGSQKRQTQTPPNAHERPRTPPNATQEKEEDKDKEEDEVSPAPFQDGGDDLLRINKQINDAIDAAAALGLNTGPDRDKANLLAADYTAEWLLEALHRTANAPKDARCWRYVEGILRSWKRSGGIDQEQKEQKPKTRKEKYNCVVNGEVVEYEREVPV